jgi:hypothetical protein
MTIKGFERLKLGYDKSIIRLPWHSTNRWAATPVNNRV